MTTYSRNKAVIEYAHPFTVREVSTSHKNPDSVASSIVSFCRFVRSRGLQVGMQQTFAALEAANLIGVDDRQRFLIVLRAALCSSHEEWLEFDRLFEEFWNHENERSDYPDSRSRRKLAGSARSANVAGMAARGTDGRAVPSRAVLSRSAR